MASINQIKASDGSGNAQIATVQNSRSGGSSTIIVDTVSGIPDNFMGSMGTPHTFTDPITSETITVISEATAVDFSGHVDGANLEIDDIAPGYVDGGSEIGDIVIIRPTTQWGDNVADVLGVSLNDDGTLKNDIVTTTKIDDDAVTTSKVSDDAITPAKRSGGFKVGVTGWDVTTTGNKSVTGLDFQPRLVKFTIGRHSSADSFFSCGAMDEDGGQYYVALDHDASANDGGTTSGSDACLAVVNLTGGTLDLKGAFVSMNADGFTVNISNAAVGINNIFYEAYA
jgi:hypothetical protein